MSNSLFPYDVQLYNRNFLNCAQRQSIVMLKHAGIPVDWLFYTGQVSTDRILQFSVIEQKPKYDFEYEGLSDQDFEVIGVERRNHYVDRFDDAKPYLLDMIKRDGFVLSSCNLFYVSHRPEYYMTKEVVHFQTLTGYDAPTGQWNMIDDNSAGILAYFTFHDDALRQFYDNGLLKGYRSFATRRQSQRIIRQEIEDLFRRHRDRRTDSLALLRQTEAYITDDPQRLKMLAEAFSLLSGSRQCFAQYLRLAEASPLWIELADQAGQNAARLRDAFTMAQVSGKLNLANIIKKALELAELEERLGALRSTVELA